MRLYLVIKKESLITIYFKFYMIWKGGILNLVGNEYNLFWANNSLNYSGRLNLHMTQLLADGKFREMFIFRLKWKLEEQYIIWFFGL